jgi:hypothetical protein
VSQIPESSALAVTTPTELGSVLFVHFAPCSFDVCTSKLQGAKRTNNKPNRSHMPRQNTLHIVTKGK